jgi:hypothetical protein
MVREVDDAFALGDLGNWALSARSRTVVFHTAADVPGSARFSATVAARASQDSSGNTGLRDE